MFSYQWEQHRGVGIGDSELRGEPRGHSFEKERDEIASRAGQKLTREVARRFGGSQDERQCWLQQNSQVIPVCSKICPPPPQRGWQGSKWHNEYIFRGKNSECWYLLDEGQAELIINSPEDKVGFGEQNKLLPNLFLWIFTQWMPSLYFYLCVLFYFCLCSLILNLCNWGKG